MMLFLGSQPLLHKTACLSSLKKHCALLFSVSITKLEALDVGVLHSGANEPMFDHQQDVIDDSLLRSSRKIISNKIFFLYELWTGGNKEYLLHPRPQICETIKLLVDHRTKE